MAKRKESVLELPGGVSIKPILSANPHQTKEGTISFSKINAHLHQHNSDLRESSGYEDFRLRVSSLLGLAHHDLATRALKGISDGTFQKVPNFLDYIADKWLADLRKGKKYEKKLADNLTHPQLISNLYDRVVPIAVRHFVTFQSFNFTPRVVESKFGYYLQSNSSQSDKEFIPNYRVPITGMIDHFMYQNGIPQVWELKSNASEFKPEYALQLATYITGTKLMDPSLALRRPDDWEGYPDPQAFVYDLGSSEWYQVFFDAKIYSTLTKIYQHGHLTLLNRNQKDLSDSTITEKVASNGIKYNLDESYQLAVSHLKNFQDLYRVVKHPKVISDEDLRSILKKNPHSYPDIHSNNHQGFLF